MKLILNGENAMRFKTTAQLVGRCRRAAGVAAVGVVFAWPVGAATAPSPVLLCLAPASAQMPGIDSEEAVAAVGEVFKRYLAGPKVRLESLTARLASQAGEEAKEKHCDYVLYTTVKQERKSSSGFLQHLAAGAVEGGASQVAANSGSTGTRVVARAAEGGAANAYYYSSFTRSSDRLTLTARLETADRAVVSEKTEKRKASSDGEDLLTPSVERAGENIIGAVSGAHP